MQKPHVYDWIPSPTRICGNKSYGATDGAANLAAPCRTLKCITENFAVTRGMTQS